MYLCRREKVTTKTHEKKNYRRKIKIKKKTTQ